MKRRFLSLFLVLILCIFSVPCALADTVEVSSFSNEELISLYSAVKLEMTKRGLTQELSLTLHEGKYIIGKDVAPGRYQLTCNETSGEEWNNAYTSLGNMFGSMSDDEGTDYGNLMGSLGGLMKDLVTTQITIVGDYGVVLKSYELKGDQSIQITLEEGTAIQVEDGSCTIVSLP